MKDPLVAKPAEGRPAEYRTAWQILFVTGLGLALVAIVDNAMLFVPANPSSLDWEFGTIGAMMMGLPMITMGLGCMAASSSAAGWTWTRRLVVVMLVVMALVVGASVVLFSLDVPPVLRAANPQFHLSIKKAAVKTVVMGLIHLGTYVVLTGWVWRARSATR
jgi:hypothetical protein